MRRNEPILLLSPAGTRRMGQVWARPIRVFQEMIIEKKVALAQIGDAPQTFVFPFHFVILASLVLILKNGTHLMGIWKVIEGPG